MADDRGRGGSGEHWLPGRPGGHRIADGVGGDRLESVFHLRGAGLQGEAAVKAQGLKEGTAVAGQPGAADLAVDPGTVPPGG